MPCELRQRRDDTPTFKGEKAWACDACGALIFSPKKPTCRLVVLAEVQARHASAEAEATELDLDNKERK